MHSDSEIAYISCISILSSLHFNVDCIDLGTAGEVAIDVAMNHAVSGAFALNSTALACTRRRARHPDTRLVAFNGALDAVVDPKAARRSFRALEGVRLTTELLKAVSRRSELKKCGEQ